MQADVNLAGSNLVRPCKHLAAAQPVEPDFDRCEECLAAGQEWSELWLCLTCGWVSCWESSREHYAETDHPIAMPLAGPPSVRWCFIDERFV